MIRVGLYGDPGGVRSCFYGGLSAEKSHINCLNAVHA